MLSSYKTDTLLKSPWLNVSHSNPTASMRLFCFPYAGGAAFIFRNWAGHIPASVELCPVQLPGRGERIAEPPYVNIPPLIDVLADSLLPYLDKPFAFFGHSLGALISFSLAQKLSRKHGLEPLHLFVSGRHAPQLPDLAPIVYNLPEGEFIAELKRLNGTPAEVLEHFELLQLILPRLRADFELCQTYQHQARPPLKCPITAFGGLLDADVSREQLEAWSEHTTATFSLRMLPGDHFFIHSSELMLLQMLTLELQQLVRRLKPEEGTQALAERLQVGEIRQAAD